MPRVTYSADETAERGEAIYRDSIRHVVEPSHSGEFVVIDVTTGEYELDKDEAAAFLRAIQRNPDGWLYIMRVGYPFAHTLGGQFPESRQ